MRLNFVCSLALLTICHAAPAKLGLNFGEQANALPTLALPYATYQATNYNPNGGIYTFKNVRFAAPPISNLRWAKPAPPLTETNTQDGSYGPICIQAPIKGPHLTGPGASSAVGHAANQFLAGIPVPSFTNMSEDCLFLDLYVPAAAVRNPSLKLPVISWFYGGAYIFGGKDQFGNVLPLYDGTGLIQQSGGNVIFVASNYRLGAYGFLAGTTMEQQGLPNAGLHDQRAALQWIQDYIHLVGGDKTQVSAWGESAGAGSIMHQLVAFGGSQDPLFSKAVMQSPAFGLKFDRKGALENVFQDFSELAGCSGQGVACLRAASAETLQTANRKLNEEGPEGIFAVGPSADGNLIRQLAVLEFASGNYYKNVDSLILSHVADEAFVFVPPNVQTDSDFNAFVDETFPVYSKKAGLNAIIEAHYPPVMSGTVHNYTTEFDRTKALLGQSSFQCNVRYLSDAYAGKNYILQYAITPGFHATDLLPTFYDLSVDLTLFGDDESYPLIPGFGSFAQAYQSYLVSHAQSGDPNTYAKTFNIPPAINWPKAGDSGDEITGVLNAGDAGFSLISDLQTTETICGFWREVAAAVTDLGGYAPPGGVVNSTLVTFTNDPSANY